MAINYNGKASANCATPPDPTASQNIMSGSWGQPIPIYNISEMSGNTPPAPTQVPAPSYGQIGETPGMTFPQTEEQAILEQSGDLPETITNPIYTPSFLRTQIGKIMRIEFLIGDNVTDRVGRLVAVGASYILLQAIDPGSTIMCDIYSIKFATIVDDNSNVGKLLYS